MILIIVALIFLALFLVPYTLLLLLVPFLRPLSEFKCLHWINTLKPFFDTYYDPFKDKKQHQVWTGILLISRVLILIVFASSSTSNPNTNVLLMTVISLLLVAYSAMVGLLYKQWLISLLEIAKLINLSILGGAFLYYQNEIRKDFISPIVTTSVCIALLQLTCTLAFQTIKASLGSEKDQQK